MCATDDDLDTLKQAHRRNDRKSCQRERHAQHGGDRKEGRKRCMEHDSGTVLMQKE